MTMRRTVRGLRLSLPLLCAAMTCSAYAETVFLPTEFRSIDGAGNNLGYTDMNSAHTPLMRHMYSAYDDSVSQMSGSARPNPRTISNTVVAQTELRRNRRNLSSFFWLWGQFLDHDIDLTEGATPHEAANIPIPAGDPWFDPGWTGTVQMQFSRSEYSAYSGTGADNPREQMNGISGWIDGSMVYGSDAERAAALRTNDGTGELKTSDGNLLPFNTAGFPNAGGPAPTLFLAGDIRANENVGLTAMHTLFVREHNRLAKIIREYFPGLTGDEIYQQARLLVGAEIQIITYKEFLPALLGTKAMPSDLSYDPSMVGTIRNEFSTAAYRLGHSLLTDELKRVDADGWTIPAGDLPLAAAFFAPQEIVDHGIDSLLRGMAINPSQDVDVYVTDAVRNFLFGGPPGGFDLASLNIQRGRDHGLPGYNEARTTMGFAPALTFADITSDTVVQNRLAQVYATPDDVDLWVGGLAEEHLPGAVVGELFHDILKTQFISLAKSDRFFYLHNLNFVQAWLIGDPSLSAIIRRNTDIGDEITDWVFYLPKTQKWTQTPSGEWQLAAVQ